IVMVDSSSGLDFQGYLCIAHHKVDLLARTQAPVTQLQKILAIVLPGRQFVEHPILQGLAKKLSARLDLTSPSQGVNYSDTGEIKLGGLNTAALGPTRVGLQVAAQKSIDQNLEILS